MAYAFVQQTDTSFTSNQSSMTSTAITVTAGNLLLVAIHAGVSSTLTLSDGGVGNTYVRAASVTDGSSVGLYLYYALNASGASTAVTVTSSASMRGICVLEYSGIATSNAFISAIGNYQNSPGGPGANVLTSGNFVVSAQPALLFGISEDPHGGGATHDAPTAGTSPIAFTGRTAIWSTFNSGTTCALPEDARLTSTGANAATFGDDANNKFDKFLTIAAAFAETGVTVPDSILGQICL